jgi:hypothetical protein
MKMGSEIRQHRETPDLVKRLADMERRLTIVETAKRLGNSSIDSGQLTLRNGDLVVVDDDGDTTLKIAHGEIPYIEMRPNTVEGGYSTIQFAWESDSNGASHQVHIQDANDIHDGGKLLLNRNTSYLSHQPAFTPETYVGVGNHGGAWSNHIRMRGRWVYNDGFDNQDAIVFGYENIAAGFGAASFSFPYAFDTIPIVLYSMYNAGTAIASDLSALGTTGFTVSWASGTTAKTIGWAAFRR